MADLLVGSASGMMRSAYDIGKPVRPRRPLPGSRSISAQIGRSRRALRIAYSADCQVHGPSVAAGYATVLRDCFRRRLRVELGRLPRSPHSETPLRAGFLVEEKVPILHVSKLINFRAAGARPEAAEAAAQCDITSAKEETDAPHR